MTRKRPTAPTAPDLDEADAEIDPHDYDPKAVRADVEAAKDFLLWSRKHGFTQQVVTIGHVQLTNVTDLYPRKTVEAAARQPRAVHDLDEFATPEEQAALGWAPGAGDQ